MCTVTFIPAKDKLYLTSNRDEKSLRKPAIPPKQYVYNGNILVYPTDGEAGGTWIAMKDDGNAVVLLNGAFEKHKPQPPYRRSRGKIFLDIVATDSPLKTYLDIDLLNIEPFTLVILHNKNLWECRWNGKKKFYKKLINTEPHIWSSATLYTKEVIAKREQWFADWLKTTSTVGQNDILNFHRFAGEGDVSNALQMNRDGKMCTVSISSIEITDKVSKMRYLDLKDNASYSAELKYSFFEKY